MSKCESSACVEVVDLFGHVRLYSSDTGTAMQVTRAEWFAFLDDVAAGKWAHIGAQETAVTQ